jgi:hypothetical protein
MVIPVQGAGLIADWGDGFGFQLFTGPYPITNYPIGGTKQVDICGAITNFGTNAPWDSGTLRRVISWSGAFNLNGAFRGCSNLISVPSTCPALSLTYAFYDCPRIDLTTIALWNMTNVTDVSYMFGPVPQNLQRLQAWTSSLTSDIVYDYFITDSSGNDISTSLSVSPFYLGPAPSAPLFTSIGSFILQPNPPVQIGETLYATNTTSLFVIGGGILYNFLSNGLICIGPCIELSSSVIAMIVSDTTGNYSLFQYTLGTGAFIKTYFISMPSMSYARDAAGTIIFADYVGNLYTSAALTVSPIPPGLSSDLTVFNNVLYATFTSGLVAVNLSTKAVTNLNAQFPAVTGLTSHLGRLYFYSSGLKSYDLFTQSISQIWDFNANPLQGTEPIGPLSVDTAAQVLYGICKSNGPGLGSGLRAAGTVWSYTLPNGPFTVLTPYVTGDLTRGSTPITYSISSGNAFVITGGGNSVAARIPATVYTMGQIMLPGYGSCFNHGTNILCQIHGADIWRPIEQLKRGDLVKTYKHGYRSITHIGKGALINNPDLWHSCMYQGQLQGFEPLIITGGHALLVDTLTQEEREAQAAFWGRAEEVIDDKILIVAPVCKDFKAILNTDVYTYYHFTVENDGDDDRRYGVWANGFLTETPSTHQYNLHNYVDC